MINFEAFVELVKEEIKNWLPDKFKNAEVSIEKVKKTNDVERVGLMIRTNRNIAPNIYLEVFYKMYQNGNSIKDILKEIAQIRVDLEADEDINVTDLMDFEKCKDQIFPQLISAEWNQEQLHKRPHMIKDDLAIVFYMHLQDSPDGEANMRITNDHLHMWHTTSNELYDLAIKNLTESKTGVFASMTSVMDELMHPTMVREDAKTVGYKLCEPSDSECECMYIVTNKSKLNGASVLLDQKFMNTVRCLLKCDFYILPSSIHECIIVPVTADVTVRALKKMVKEVNATKVTVEERLSDSVYTYNIDCGLMLA